MFLLFYLIYDDNITGLLNLIDNDPKFPVVMTHGYFTGKICNPKLIYVNIIIIIIMNRWECLLNQDFCFYKNYNLLQTFF